MSFEDAVQPAQRLIEVFSQLPSAFLEQLPTNELNAVKQQADAVYQQFNSILEFNLEQQDPRSRRDQAIQSLRDSYQRLFTQLYPLVSYSMARTVDFNQLEGNARAAVQSIRDQTDKLMEELADQKSEAAGILEEVRQAAAEQGVSQQASYFKEEADKHGTECGKWRTRTIWMAIAVGCYGLLTLVLHKVPFLSPNNLYETIQFTVGKLIMFFVLTYMLVLCAKNFLSNRHNEIVNRHRQNALMTYKALVDAGGTPEARDVVLTHAASSIYKLHETGYARASDGGGASSSSVVEMIPRTSVPLNMGGGG